MENKARYISRVGIAVLVLLLSACNATKFVPANQYLLEDAKIHVVDTKQVDPTDLRSYLRQTPNAEILGFWKLQLHIYNTAPVDTATKSKKRLARNAQRVGEAPVIYDPDLTAASMFHLQKAMQNKGYFDATVDTMIRIKKKRLSITYLITANRPYLLHQTSYNLPQTDLEKSATDERRTLLQKDVPFDSDLLNEERKRIETNMRSHGYYYFQKEMLRYEADSSIGNHQVDVEMSLQPYVAQSDDSAYQSIFSTYKVRNVHFIMDYEGAAAQDSGAVVSQDGGYTFTCYGKKLLRERVLKRVTRVHPDELFDQRKVDKSYEALNGLGVIKYVDISFIPVGDHELDCQIMINRQKLHSVSAQVEGTYTSGDWGVAVEAGYTNRNAFFGAEELSVKARGSYEWRQNGGRAIEGLINAGLRFPNRIKVQLEGRYQDRPEEYNRIIANVSFGYLLRKSTMANWAHNFRFVDLSYVYLPWISDDFRKTFLESSNLMKYSYEDHFIMAFGYQANYSSFRQHHPYRSYGTVCMSVETAGNVLYGIAKLADFPTNTDGNYKLGNILFSQYAKFDFNFTGHAIANERHRVVFRGAIGVAVPYGNSNAMPFEKRYYAGGANGVRGWTARALGPGVYRTADGVTNYDTQVGDIRVDLSAEYRVQVWKSIHAAAFVDAGNIWTIQEYKSQSGGAFHWNSFYKQLGLSYGTGLRLDLSFLILRLDLGIRLYDPARIAEGRQWRTATNGLSWKNDCALHFAIGYPF